MGILVTEDLMYNNCENMYSRLVETGEWNIIREWDFEANGFSLKDLESVCFRHDFYFRCPNGHLFKDSFWHTGCPECKTYFDMRFGRRNKLTMEFDALKKRYGEESLNPLIYTNESAYNEYIALIEKYPQWACKYILPTAPFSEMKKVYPVADEFITQLIMSDDGHSVTNSGIGTYLIGGNSRKYDTYMRQYVRILYQDEIKLPFKIARRLLSHNTQCYGDDYEAEANSAALEECDKSCSVKEHVIEFSSIFLNRLENLIVSSDKIQSNVPLCDALQELYDTMNDSSMKPNKKWLELDNLEFIKKCNKYEHNIRKAVEFLNENPKKSSKPFRVVDLKLRQKILRRDNFTCQLCGAKAPDVRVEVDHKVPYSKGGETVESNLWTLCWECNHGKSNNYID